MSQSALHEHPSQHQVEAVRPTLAPQEVFRRFTRGTEAPRGVVWFGARSFWGHLRHLAASAIASENIDSRAWMEPDSPEELLRHVIGVLGGDADAGSLSDAMGRDVIIDFIADTGDDTAVSRAVARLMFAAYELPDPDRPGEFTVVPRGDVLFFGGDTAYPVATAKEIANRIIVPWNQVLEALPDDGQRRVLLGIPGNHDWYDGLDGFARLFRRHNGEAPEPPSASNLSPGMREQHAAWAREFVRGGAIDKPSVLALRGYTPVQGASYFALELTPGLDLFAVDRQLTGVDHAQIRYFKAREGARPDVPHLVVLPDPVHHFGVPSRTGTQMVEELELDPTRRETFFLSGDIHHYERVHLDKVVHVIAGGGGAFVHPARIASGGVRPEVIWPNVPQSRRLLGEVPWKLMLGRSGCLPHLGLLLLLGLAVYLCRRLQDYVGLIASSSALTAMLLTVFNGLLGGALRRPIVWLLAGAAALLTTAIPIVSALGLDYALDRLGQSLPGLIVSLLALAFAVFGGTYVFGAYLALLTLLGYENMQAFAVLDHPGFKHFVRLRLRADGTGLDAWCVGTVDPLGAEGRPVLVDHFAWRPKRRSTPGRWRRT